MADRNTGNVRKQELWDYLCSNLEILEDDIKKRILHEVIEELVREEREKAIAECGISQDKVNLGSADNMEKEEAIKIRRELLAKMPIVLPY